MVPAGHGYRPGTSVYVEYDVEGEPWHERLILSALGADDYVVFTADKDMYVETIAVPPLRNHLPSGPNGKTPEGLGARFDKPVYKFSYRPAASTMERLFREADALAVEHKLAHPTRYAAVTGAGPPGPLPLRDDAGPPGPLPLRDDVGLRLADDEVWICVDPTSDSYRVGDAIQDRHIREGVQMGLKGLIRESPGRTCFVARVPRGSTTEVEAFRSGWAVETPRGAVGAKTWGLPTGGRGKAPAGDSADDARTLPVLKNSAGERFRDVKSVAEVMAQTDLADWPLEGPRTARWWWTEVSRTGMGPASRHQAWKHENKLNEDDHLCTTHEMLSEVVELMGCLDQLDLSNLASAESAIRHLQYVEHEVKKKVESKRAPDNSEYFLGRIRRTGGCIIDPNLLKWVAERASRDSQILKEQRKAAEERALLKAPKK